MAEEAHDVFVPTSDSKSAETTLTVPTKDDKMKMDILPPSEKDISTLDESSMTCQFLKLQSVLDVSNPCQDTEQLSPPAGRLCSQTINGTESKHSACDHGLNVDQLNMNNAEDKENTAIPAAIIIPSNSHKEETNVQSSCPDSSVTASKQNGHMGDCDDEVVRRAREEGRVNILFPGTVTQEGCYRFVSEILKCILYQRQQLPMTYDQLVYSQKKQQASMQQEKHTESRRPVQSADLDWRKCQQTLQDLEEVLQQLEVLFSLSRVPRVLLLMGGSITLPKELYEINMEALVVAGGDQCLRVSSCLRQLFRTLFVADLLSDTRPVRLMPTTVLVLAHRDCGVGWFRPKLQFKVPTRIKNQVIALSTDPSNSREPRAKETDWQDYVWFQTPMAIKGFGK